MKGEDHLVGKCHGSREDSSCGLGHDRALGISRSWTCGDRGEAQSGKV